MLTVLGIVALLIWVMVGYTVGRAAYLEVLPTETKFTNVAGAVIKGIVWPTYLLYKWIRDYIKGNY